MKKIKNKRLNKILCISPGAAVFRFQILHVKAMKTGIGLSSQIQSDPGVVTVVSLCQPLVY